VRTSIRNAYRNAKTPIVLVNHLLQGRPRSVGVDFARFVMNTTVGIAGIMDPAAAIGLAHEDGDFGQTFGIWGIPAGPYLVVPLIGPSTPRDGVGLVLDTAAFAVGYFVPFWASASISAIDFANRYSFVVKDVARERDAAFDWYAAVRNAYMSNRWEKVHGPSPPADEEDEDDLYYLEDELE
jgi:phospholipid-binding lipoprotein MlaA